MSSEKHDVKEAGKDVGKDVKETAKEVKAAAKDKASRAAKEAHGAVDKAQDEFKKQVNNAEGILKPYWDKFVEFVSNVASTTAGATQAAVSNVAYGTSKAASVVFHELQNPVVAVNAILGAASITTILNGYAHKKRFLKDKSDQDICLIVSGVSAFVAADAYVSYKNYKKFDKKWMS